MDEKNQQRLAERPLWILHRDVYEVVLALFVRHDPIRIASMGNPKSATEYAAEVDTILPRLQRATSVHDVHQIVYEEFVQWFGSSAGAYERYVQIAGELWNVMQDPTIQGQLPRIVDVPRQMTQFVDALLNQFVALEPEVYLALAQGLRREARHLEVRARGIQRHADRQSFSAGRDR
jgi:hypothetical protein